MVKLPFKRMRRAERPEEDSPAPREAGSQEESVRFVELEYTPVDPARIPTPRIRESVSAPEPAPVEEMPEPVEVTATEGERPSAEQDAPGAPLSAEERPWYRRSRGEQAWSDATLAQVGERPPQEQAAQDARPGSRRGFLPRVPRLSTPRLPFRRRAPEPAPSPAASELAQESALLPQDPALPDVVASPPPPPPAPVSQERPPAAGARPTRTVVVHLDDDSIRERVDRLLAARRSPGSSVVREAQPLLMRREDLPGKPEPDDRRRHYVEGTGDNLRG